MSMMSCYTHNAQQHSLRCHNESNDSTECLSILGAEAVTGSAGDTTKVTPLDPDAEKGIHVYGASMGGFVAQRLALMLLARGRLASLLMAVTSRGLSWRLPLPYFQLFKWMLPFVMSKDPGVMVSRGAWDGLGHKAASWASGCSTVAAAACKNLTRPSSDGGRGRRA